MATIPVEDSPRLNLVTGLPSMIFFVQSLDKSLYVCQAIEKYLKYFHKS
jgi:hypothetical protein